MFRLTKKLIFAIEAVLDIAYNTYDTPVQSADITARQGIPRRYLEQVLQELVRAGVLTGVRGPRGGYKLARERRRITLGEIVRVVRTVETAQDPLSIDGHSRLGREIVRPVWQKMVDDCMAKLDATTVDDLCRQAQERGIAREGLAGTDWSI